MYQTQYGLDWNRFHLSTIKAVEQALSPVAVSVLTTQAITQALSLNDFEYNAVTLALSVHASMFDNCCKLMSLSCTDKKYLKEWWEREEEEEEKKMNP